MKTAIFPLPVAAPCLGGLLLLASSQVLAADPPPPLPLAERVSRAMTDIQGALQGSQSDASASIEFDKSSGFCKRAQASFRLPRRQGGQTEPAWFDFSPTDTRADAQSSGFDKTRLTLLLSPGASSKISLRVGGKQASPQAVENLPLGDFLQPQGRSLSTALQQLSELCNETAQNVQKIRTSLASSGYTISNLQGKSGAVADRCTLKVVVSSLQRTLPLGGTCAAPRVATRIVQPEMAKALGLAPGQILPHLSCKKSQDPQPAGKDEIPLKKFNGAELESLQNALRLYASNQTSCGSLPRREVGEDAGEEGGEAAVDEGAGLLLAERAEGVEALDGAKAGAAPGLLQRQLHQVLDVHRLRALDPHNSGCPLLES